MELHTRINRNPELIAVDMDGEMVMMDAQSGNYFGINATGAHIWNLLETEQTLQTILTDMQNTHQLPEDHTLQDDVSEFLADMLQQNIITAHTDPA
jgi:hypothetical protein